MEKVKMDEDVEQFLKLRMNKLFKSVLGVIEKETKQAGMNEEFFKKNGKTKKGFSLIRKVLFDHGNDIVETTSFVLKQLISKPAGSVILYTPEALKEVKEENSTSP